MNEYEDNNCIFVGAFWMWRSRVKGGGWIAENDLSGVCIYTIHLKYGRMNILEIRRWHIYFLSF